jgi:outer membrane protein OmpA-like peptidoglycan-associated protein
LEKSRHELRVRLLISGVLLACLLGCGESGSDRSAGSIPTDDSALSTDDTPIAPSQDASSLPSGAAQPKPSQEPPDTDRDGVVDASDACPGTEANKRVDASGCPIDPDGDGVVGPNDLCPNSPYGEPVDETGCRPRLAVAQEYTLLLTFEAGSAKIIGDPRGALAEVAALMTQYPETTVVIEGHTDDRGPAKFNLKISKARADAVSKVLITDLGIDAARVSTKGFGKTKPIATNATKEGRERNRRVVAVVMPGKAPTPPTEAAAEHHANAADH